MNKIRISYPLIGVVPVLVFFDTEYKLLSVLAAMAIHEAGHIWGMVYRKIAFNNIKIGICGAVISYGKDRLTSYAEDVFIALMGSVFNFLVIVAAFVMHRLTGWNFDFFIGINALLGLFNMIPIIPLDGGRVMVSILSIKFGVNAAAMIMKAFGIIVALLGIVTGFRLCILQHGNFTLLMVSSVVLLKNIYEL